MQQSYAEYYHNRTKYSPEGIKKAGQSIDWVNQPIPFKEYPRSNSVSLTKYLKEKRENFTEPVDSSMATLSRLLYYTNGITAIVAHSTPLLLRSAPSAGGLYPTEVYVITYDYPGLKDGIYNYQVGQHALAEIQSSNVREDLYAACFEHPSFEGSNLTMVFTGVFYRSSWRYHERAYRRILLDTGHVIGNAMLYAPFAGKYPHLIGGFDDQELNDLLLLDSEEEVSLALLNFTEQSLHEKVSATLASDIGDESLKGVDLIRSFHNAGNIEKMKYSNFESSDEDAASTSPLKKLSFTVGEKLPQCILNWDNKLEEVILARRSTRAYSGEAITREELSQILSFTYQPELYANQDFEANPDFFDLSLIDTYIAISNVHDLEDGCYYLEPSKLEMHQLRFKNLQEELYFLCLGQELGKNASAVVFHTVNLPLAVQKYGERVYRYLHMDAGILGQRLNLACIKLGLGVSGIGGFFDEQANELLGIPDTKAILYITTIGIPLLVNSIL